MPSPLSTNRASARGIRTSRANPCRFALAPILVLLIGAGISFWKVNERWQQLLQAQRSRHSSQAFLSQAEEALAAEKEQIQAYKEELEKLQSEAERKRKEVGSSQHEIDRYKDDCSRRRHELKEQYDREIDDVTWEARSQAFQRMQTLKEMEERSSEQRNASLFNLRQDYKQSKSALDRVESKLAHVEMDRVLFRMLGNTSESYVKAYYDRLRRGQYSDTFTVTLDYLSKMQAMAYMHAGLWYVDSEGERVSLGSVPAGLMDVLPKADYLGVHYPRGGLWRSCAVVGNSGLLLKYRQGRAIDAHDAVFRFNDAPTKGFEDHVGRRTTLRIVEDAYHMAARAQPSKQTVLQIIKSQEVLHQFMDYKLQPSSMNLYMMAPDLELHVSRYTLRATPVEFIGVALAMQKCRRVTVYGIANNYRGNVQFRYFSKDNPGGVMRSAVGSHHDPDANTMGLFSELSQRSGGSVQLSVPCVSMYHCFNHCRNCTQTFLSPGGACECDRPLPVPKPGYCTDAPPRGTLANCFRKCPGGERKCPGGSAQGNCDQLRVPIDTTELECGDE
ncbi:hypothetical protein CYMTET_11936 [Cymbomonas tetramitiformis]|uniref:beta-galactoside alpha-(2,6)-sialyltransferase n=1 Tax=Cymbomonas tetramitiformis TaxID=36881 RepID=A0AAE0LCN8_9CHLO|nr:hypothetical protein CYMTET_11936 [Cymbomonas tetramitiformis]